MKNRIFRGVFFTCLCTLILSLCACILVVLEVMTAHTEKELKNYTLSLAEYLDNHGDRMPDLSRGTFRVTLIHGGGDVLFDSGDTPDEELGNHRDREEFKEALNFGYGESSRYSSTLLEKSFYAAVRLNSGSVVRCSVTADTVIRSLPHFFSALLFIGIAAALLSVYTSRTVADTIVQPLLNLNLDKPLENEIYDELYPLLHRLSNQQHQLAAQTATIVRREKAISIITGSMTEGLLVLDGKGVILHINKVARNIFKTGKDCVGRNFLTLVHTQAVCELFESTETPKRTAIDLPFEDRFFRLFFNRISVHKTRVGYALVLVDITDELAALKQRQEFTANVSHELKTPLQTIIGSAELLQSGVVSPDDMPKFARSIYRQGQNLLTMVNSLILLSRLDERSPAPTEDLNIREMCEFIFESLKSQAEKMWVTLSYEGDENCIFKGNRAYLYEVMTNLTQNAIKYNREGGYVKVYWERDDNALTLKVEDNGIGIAKEDQEHVFERFFRSDRSRNKTIEGSGLGLAIVKRVVLYYKGSISVSGELGKGSVFTAVLREQKVPKDAGKKKKSEPPALPNPAEGQENSPAQA